MRNLIVAVLPFIAAAGFSGLMFSATLSREIETLTKQYQRDPQMIEVGRRTSPAETVTQLLYECPGALKQVMLHHLLKDEALKCVLVFARTKHGADRVCRKLQGEDISCAAIHANRSQSQRQRALQAFKNGEIRVLVATDIASRGIDVDGISHVFNFDFPDQLEDYVHRIGRTGRALSTGTAITFVTREDLGELRRLERIVGKHLHCGKLQGFDYTQQAPPRTPEDFQRHQDPRAGAHHSEREGRPQAAGQRGGAALAHLPAVDRGRAGQRSIAAFGPAFAARGACARETGPSAAQRSNGPCGCPSGSLLDAPGARRARGGACAEGHTRFVN